MPVMDGLDLDMAMCSCSEGLPEGTRASLKSRAASSRDFSRGVSAGVCMTSFCECSGRIIYHSRVKVLAEGRSIGRTSCIHSGDPLDSLLFFVNHSLHFTPTGGQRSCTAVCPARLTRSAHPHRRVPVIGHVGQRRSGMQSHLKSKRSSATQAATTNISDQRRPPQQQPNRTICPDHMCATQALVFSSGFQTPPPPPNFNSPSALLHFASQSPRRPRGELALNLGSGAPSPLAPTAPGLAPPLALAANAASAGNRPGARCDWRAEMESNGGGKAGGAARCDGGGPEGRRRSRRERGGVGAYGS
ncbi:hypothetical protein EJ06DRAFT_109217 [Trichodelitschia bisporula]|uniref:Uncharacterized protein n=1 Tax=Trichodelitschia bisporula TaxID=703511 RepID=A0A6G1HRJ2_9PEZI|nr:hypothetical protein EJ06DRAFT_109217 [Trichodelitschia bisporula]